MAALYSPKKPVHRSGRRVGGRGHADQPASLLARPVGVPGAEVRMISDPAVVMSQVERELANAPTAIIGLDGATGVGKSTLTGDIHHDLGATVIEVDSFHEQNGYPYVDNLRLLDLKDAISSAREEGVPVIIDGICLLDVLARIELKPDILIYLHPRPNSLESDFLRCDREIEDIFAGIGTTGTARLDMEICRYTRRFEPHKVAHIQFQWPKFGVDA